MSHGGILDHNITYEMFFKKSGSNTDYINLDIIRYQNTPFENNFPKN